jgi:hypothetical protein
MSFIINNNTLIKLDRLEFIALTNPEWAEKIMYFLEVHPEFQPYRQIAPSTERAIENNEDWAPKNIFEHSIYYVSASGVNVEYANDQFKKIVLFLRSGQGDKKWEDINSRLYQFLIDNSIQPKKKQIYWDMFCWMGNNKIRDTELNLSHIESMQIIVKGLGPGFLAHMRGHYSNKDNCMEYTDIGFKKGFKKIYGTDNLTEIKKKIDEIASEGYGRIFNGFIFTEFFNIFLINK